MNLETPTPSVERSVCMGCQALPAGVAGERPGVTGITHASEPQRSVRDFYLSLLELSEL